jgi:RND family efflux transporter MFP subunit
MTIIPRASRPGRPKRRLLPLAWLGLGLAATLATTAPSRAQATPEVSAQVQVAPLRQGQLAQTVHALGSVTTASSQNLAIAFARQVQVQQVLVRLGQRVKQGQPLISVQTAPGADLAYTQAQSAVRYAQADLLRVQQLAAQQLATTTQVDAARKALADAQAQLAAAQQQGMGRSTGATTAPFAGVVTAVLTTPGALLASGSAALTLAPAAGLQAVVGVTPEVAAALVAGQPAKLQPVFDPDKTDAATVLSIAGVVDPQSHLVNVTLALSPQAAGLLPGLAVQAQLELRQWQGWVVPRQAVLRDASGQGYVFQDNHGKAARVNVKIEMDQAEHSGISGPLNPALPLVVLGNDELLQGMALQVVR